MNRRGSRRPDLLADDQGGGEAPEPCPGNQYFGFIHVGFPTKDGACAALILS